MIIEEFRIDQTGTTENFLESRAFEARAIEEIKRAKRYPTFISLLVLDISHIIDSTEIDENKVAVEVFESLKNLIRNSIRETDILGIRIDLQATGKSQRNNVTGLSYKGRIAILLIETQEQGALALARRLKKTMKYFLCNNIKSPLKWRVPFYSYSFPSAKGGADNFARTIRRILN